MNYEKIVAALGVKLHVVTTIFPWMDPIELLVLAEDIQKNGLANPIVRHEGFIIDGKNRLVACMIASVEPRYVEWDGKGSITDYVVGMNLFRDGHQSRQGMGSEDDGWGARGLAYRAMIEKAKGVYGEAAKEDAWRAVLAVGKSRDSWPEEKVRAARKAAREVRERERKARLGPNTMASRLNTIWRRGVPELVALVESGTMSRSDAARISKLPHSEQSRLVSAGREAWRAWVEADKRGE